MLALKKIIIKLDRFFLNQLTEYIKRWIAKKEFKKHKIDFLIRVEVIDLLVLFVFAIVIPTMLYLVEGKIISAVAQAILWIFFVGGIRLFGLMHNLKNTKPWYDQLFAMRKNPTYYKINKEILEELFISKRRMRVMLVGINCIMTFSVVGLLLLSSVVMHSMLDPNDYVGFYLLFSLIFTSISNYIFYVFDFDEPEPKEKKQTDSVSDIIKQEWRRIIEGMSPSPNYGS